MQNAGGAAYEDDERRNFDLHTANESDSNMIDSTAVDCSSEKRFLRVFRSEKIKQN